MPVLFFHSQVARGTGNIEFLAGKQIAGPGRPLRRGRQGNLWLACSGVNGIAFVQVKNKNNSKVK